MRERRLSAKAVEVLAELFPIYGKFWSGRTWWARRTGRARRADRKSGWTDVNVVFVSKSPARTDGVLLFCRDGMCSKKERKSKETNNNYQTGSRCFHCLRQIFSIPINRQIYVRKK